jgi:hypothetical protein
MPAMILKYWKFGAVGILLMGAFLMGQRWEQAAYEKERTSAAEAIAVAISTREKAIRAEHQAQLAADAEARSALAFDLAGLRTRERELVSRIDELNLVKPITNLVVEGCTEDEEGLRVVLANPFSDDFVRVWNESSRSNPAE